MSPRSTLHSLGPTGPNEVTTRAFSEGEPGADPTAWVFERSLEGESEIPRVSAGTDAEANARWSSTGLTRAHHHAGAGFGCGRCLVAGLFRRRLLWQFRCHRSGEKLQRSSSTRRHLSLRGRSARSFGISRPLALRSPLLPGCRPAHVGCRGRRLLRYRSPSPR